MSRSIPSIPNIVFFGAAGSGKSSIINMLAGRQVASVANGLKGCTFESSCYEVDINGSTFNLWDTAGLNEAVTGQVPNTDATVSLFRLLKSLNSGLNLLVFCMQGGRIQDVAPMNWRLFHEVICDRKVPIVIAITHLELEKSMDAWWGENRGSFERHEMLAHGVACITASRGKEMAPGVHKLDAEYAESRPKMMDLLSNSHLKKAWIPPKDWFSTIFARSSWLWRWVPLVEKGKVVELGKRCGMTDKEAWAFAGVLSKA